MTALNIATQIPSNIVNVEQLSMWCANVLATLNSDLTAVEGLNYAQNAAQSGTFFIANTNQARHIARQSLELDPAYQVGGLKPWMYAKELSAKALTAAMTSN
jgi:hypothetical protein